MIMLPRRFRPHTIEIIKQAEENENGVSEGEKIRLLHVKADPNYGIRQSKRGITTDDKIIVYVELGDVSIYGENEKPLKYGCGFELNTNDTMKFREREYVITSVNEILFDSENPVRLEIIAK